MTVCTRGSTLRSVGRRWCQSLELVSFVFIH